VITPFRSLLEPDQENSQMLQRFLRAARGPFLLLLLAPALLPAAFNEVPHAAPTGKLGLEGLLHLGEPPTYDVSRHLGGYLLGLAAWLLGIQAGVLIIKAFIRFSALLHGTRVPVGVSQLLASVGNGLRRSREMARGRGSYGPAGEASGAGPPGDSEPRGRPIPRCPNAMSDACPGAGCPRGEPTGGPSSPPDCLARGQLRVAALVFALLFLATYAVLGYAQFKLHPAFAICVALAVLAMGYATIAYLPQAWQVPVTLLLVASVLPE